MATQTEYVAPAPNQATAALTSGTVARQWMMPNGVYVNEAGSAVVVTAARPVVQTSG